MLAATNATSGPSVESGGNRESIEGCSVEVTEAEEVAIVRNCVPSKSKTGSECIEPEPVLQNEER
jgi:hypothetical protein